jgi:hypothetical protein
MGFNIKLEGLEAFVSILRVFPDYAMAARLSLLTQNIGKSAPDPNPHRQPHDVNNVHVS